MPVPSRDFSTPRYFIDEFRSDCYLPTKNQGWRVHDAGRSTMDLLPHLYGNRILAVFRTRQEAQAVATVLNKNVNEPSAPRPPDQLFAEIADVHRVNTYNTALCLCGKKLDGCTAYKAAQEFQQWQANNQSKPF